MNRATAINLARDWLTKLRNENEGQVDFQHLGLTLAECALNGLPLPAQKLQPEQIIPDLPDVASIVHMGRSALIELSRNYNNIGRVRITDGHLVLPYLAVSFARADDLQTVAALLRLAAIAGIANSLTQSAWNYVLSQQHPNGPFGLLSAEIELLNRAVYTVSPQLVMTVEVLWALAAYEASNANQHPRIVA